jgi:hypothetical protein
LSGPQKKWKNVRLINPRWNLVKVFSMFGFEKKKRGLIQHNNLEACTCPHRRDNDPLRNLVKNCNLRNFLDDYALLLVSWNIFSLGNFLCPLSALLKKKYLSRSS